MGLRDHLDAALAQQGAGELVVQFVIYNLPGRDCAALASNGELGADEICRATRPSTSTRSRRSWPTPKYAQPADRQRSSRSTRCRTWSPTLAAADRHPAVRHDEGQRRLRARASATRWTSSARSPTSTTTSTPAHHGWIGWDDNFGPTADLFKRGRHRRGRHRRTTCTASSPTPPTTGADASRTSPSTTSVNGTVGPAVQVGRLEPLRRRAVASPRRSARSWSRPASTPTSAC